MRPQIGDLLHFYAICAGCQNLSRTHYMCRLTDNLLRDSLPDFPSRNRFGPEEGVFVYHDHISTKLTAHKMNLSGLIDGFLNIFRSSQSSPFPDTHLMIFCGANIFLAGPDRNIIPLKPDAEINPRALRAAQAANLTNFNYVEIDFEFRPTL